MAVKKCNILIATLLKEEVQSWLIFFFIIIWGFSPKSSSGEKDSLKFTFWKDKLQLKE